MSEEGEVRRLTHRSVSQMSTFSSCGERYRLEKIEKAPSRPAAWLTQGVAFHHAIDLWESTGRTATAEQVTVWFKEEWDRMFESQKADWPNPMDWMTGGRKKAENDWTDRFNLGVQQCLGYIQYALATAHEWRPLEIAPDMYAIELPFEIVIGNTTVKGAIDQAIEFRNGAVRVRDLKTGTKLPASPIQLGVYRIALDRILGIDAPTGDYFMVKNMEPTEGYDLSRFTEAVVGQWFDNMNSAVEMGFFLPNPGDACRICSVEKFCTVKGTEYETFPLIPLTPINN